jgi:hypothetical protein
MQHDNLIESSALHPLKRVMPTNSEQQRYRTQQYDATGCHSGVLFKAACT